MANNKCKIENCIKISKYNGFCKIHYHKDYYQKNKKKFKEGSKQYYKKNKLKIIKGAKNYYLNNKEKVLEYHKEYAKRPKVIIQRKKYNKENKEKIKIQQKVYYNQPEIKRKKEEYMKEYCKKNYNKIKKVRLAYGKKRWNENINHRLRETISNRIRAAIKKGYKKSKSVILIGCSIKDLKNYLEKQFEPNMSWSNHGEWHIDHILPCAVFDLTKEDEQKKCFHYTNLQPLWAKENISKGCKT